MMNESFIFIHEKEKQKIRRKLELIEKCLGLDHPFVTSKTVRATGTPWTRELDYSGSAHFNSKVNDWQILNECTQQKHASSITNSKWKNALNNSSYNASIRLNKPMLGVKAGGMNGVSKDFSRSEDLLKYNCESRQSNNLIHSSYTAQKCPNKESPKRSDKCKRKFIFWNNQYRTQTKDKNKVSHVNYSNNTRNEKWRTITKRVDSKFNKETFPSLHPRAIKKAGNSPNYKNSTKNFVKPGYYQNTDDTGIFIKAESVSPRLPDDRSVNSTCNNEVCEKTMTFHLTQVSEDSCLFNADSSNPIFLNFQVPNKKCKCCGHTATKADSNLTSMYLSTEYSKHARPAAKTVKPKIDSVVRSADNSKISDIGTKKKEKPDQKSKKQNIATNFTPIVNPEFPQSIQLIISPATGKQGANTNDETPRLDKRSEERSITDTKEDLTDISQASIKDPSISEQQSKINQDKSNVSQSCQTMYTCHQSSDGFMILRLFDANAQSTPFETKQTKDEESERTPNIPKSCKSDDTISAPQSPARKEVVKHSEPSISVSTVEKIKTEEAKAVSICQHLPPSQSKCCHMCCCDTNHCADCSCCKPTSGLPKPPSCFDNAIAGPITQVFDVPAFEENYKDLQLATTFNLDGANVTSLSDVQLLLDIRIEKIMDESSDQEQEVQKKHKRGYANSSSDE